MHLNVTRIIADAAEDAVYGVNAWLASVPKDASDAIPSNVTVRDQTRNDTAARAFAQAQEPDGDGPWLDIAAVEPAEIQQLHTGGDTTADGFGVYFRWRIRSASTADAVTEGFLTMRAVRRFLRELCKDAQAADRIRNGVQLVDVLSFRHLPADVSEDGEHVVVGGLAMVQAKDYETDF